MNWTKEIFLHCCWQHALKKQSNANIGNKQERCSPEKVLATWTFQITSCSRVTMDYNQKYIIANIRWGGVHQGWNINMHQISQVCDYTRYNKKTPLFLRRRLAASTQVVQNSDTLNSLYTQAISWCMRSEHVAWEHAYKQHQWSQNTFFRHNFRNYKKSCAQVGAVALLSILRKPAAHNCR